MEGVVLSKLPANRETPRSVAFGYVKRQKKSGSKKSYPPSISVLTDTIHSTIFFFFLHAWVNPLVTSKNGSVCLSHSCTTLICTHLHALFCERIWYVLEIMEVMSKCREKEEEEEEKEEVGEDEILKRRISTHPSYGLLLEAHLGCLKVFSLSLFLSFSTNNF